MKKISLLFIFFIISVFLFPSYVDATSMYVSVKCNNINVGEITTCTINGNATGGTIKIIDISISINGPVSIQGSPTMGSTFSQSLKNDSTRISYMGGNGSGTFTIATLKIKGNSVGIGKISLSNITAGDSNYEDINVNSVSRSFSITSATSPPTSPPPVTKPTTNSGSNTPGTKPTTNSGSNTPGTKPTTNSGSNTPGTKPTTNSGSNRPTTHPTTNSSGSIPTTHPTTNSSNNPWGPNVTTNANGEYPWGTNATTNANGEYPWGPNATSVHTNSKGEVITTKYLGTPLVLDYVIVDNFNVSYRDGKYFVTTNYDTESVEITAGANEKITILGQGTRNLAIGKNVVELVLRNEANETGIVQVIITRPDDLNYYDTLLSLLKVVGYDIKFDKNKKEYTLSVDSSVKELYVIAESNNSDVYISGAGLKKLTKGNNDIHVLSQYGDKASTEYIIHIKKSYTTTIMGCVSGILIVGLFATSAYFIIDKKKLLVNHKNEKSKIIADANRTVIANQMAPTLNGKSVVGTGKTNVVPQQVVDKKIPTNPVTVAQSTTIPNNNKISNNVKENISKPFPQVKVIKTKTQGQQAVVQTPIQTQVNTSQQVKTINNANLSNNYKNEQIIVNRGK